MVLVNDVYLTVCSVLLEPNGLVSGIVTPGTFLDYFLTVYQDFTQQTGLVKALAIILSKFSISTYTEPEYAMDVQDVLYDDRYLNRDSGFYIDQLMPSWQTSMDNPRVWHEDRLPTNMIEILPKPNAQGHPVIISGVSGGLGIPSTVDTAGDFTFAIPPSVGWYGTPSISTGPTYWEPANDGYGIISDMVGSPGNLMMVTTRRSTSTSFQLTDVIEMIPDSFTVYLKYGILAKIFGADTEFKDVLRARYCAARYQEGIYLAQAIAGELEDEDNMMMEQQEAVSG